MDIKEIFAQRLQRARIMKGLSMEQLCNAMDNKISKMSISKYETCKATPDSSIIIALAAALNLPEDYFFKPFTINIDSIEFLTLSESIPQKDKNTLSEIIADFIERYTNIEEICNENIVFPYPFDDIIENQTQIKTIALQLRQIWELGLDGIVNVTALLESHGIKILEINMENTVSYATAIVNNSIPVFVISKNLPSEEKRFILFRELANLMLDFPSSMSSKNKTELCSLFASEMLIPEDIFIRLVDIKRHDISYEELKAIQKEYGISCSALMYKAYNSNIISDQTYRAYIYKKNHNPLYNKLMEESLYPQEESLRFSRLVHKALSNNFITNSQAEALLQKTVEEIKL